MNKVKVGPTLKNLMKNPVFICTGITISNLFFVVTGIQYWITYYLQTVIGAKKNDVFILYSCASITGPTLGVLIGGLVITKCVGGYTNRKALNVCFFMALCACFACIPVPFLD